MIFWATASLTPISFLRSAALARLMSVWVVPLIAAPDFSIPRPVALTVFLAALSVTVAVFLAASLVTSAVF